MGVKQHITIEERQQAQEQLKKLVTNLIRSSITAAELQLDHMIKHTNIRLPTCLNYRETIREISLIIEEYKSKKLKQNEQSNQS